MDNDDILYHGVYNSHDLQLALAGASRLTDHTTVDLLVVNQRETPRRHQTHFLLPSCLSSMD